MASTIVKVLLRYIATMVIFSPIWSHSLRLGNISLAKNKQLPLRKNNRSPIEPRIVGGELVVFGELPWQVRVEVRVGDSTGLCGGSLLDFKNLRFVVTAAHCLWTGPDALTIYNVSQIDVIGADLNSASFQPREQWFGVQHAVLHPDYDPRHSLNDIALIFLDHYAHESQGLRHIALPDFGWLPPDTVQVSGYGAEDFYGTNVGILQKVDSAVVPWTVCKKFPHYFDLEKILGPKAFCVGNTDLNNRRGPCLGDSGGPAVGYNFVFQDWFLLGVASYSINRICGDPYSAAVYTRVSEYVDWIKGYAQGWLDVHGTGNPFAP